MSWVAIASSLKMALAQVMKSTHGVVLSSVWLCVFSVYLRVTYESLRPQVEIFTHTEKVVEIYDIVVFVADMTFEMSVRSFVSAFNK